MILRNVLISSVILPLPYKLCRSTAQLVRKCASSPLQSGSDSCPVVPIRMCLSSFIAGLWCDCHLL